MFWKMSFPLKPINCLPHSMSLRSAHTLGTTAGSNSFEVSKAIVQAQMLSGRYPTDYLSRHWTNRDGSCSLPSCRDMNTPGTLEHLLLSCPSLASCRENLSLLITSICMNDAVTRQIVNIVWFKCLVVQFLLDCTAIPEVTDLVLVHGKQTLLPLFHISRTWCYNVHRARHKLLGQWVHV